VNKTQSNWLKRGLPVYLALALLVVISAFFLFEVFSFDQETAEHGVTEAAPEDYQAIVSGLLEKADAQRGETLLEQYQCSACHIAGAANNIAPSYDGLGERAVTRKPNMSAEAYLYESIIHPSAYVVEGYNNVMRQDYAAVIPERDLGDIIAYLLTR
jgi:cytochrome c2